MPTAISPQGTLSHSEALYFRDLNAYVLITDHFLYRISDGGIIRFNATGKEKDMYDINHFNAVNYGERISRSEFEAAANREVNRTLSECIELVYPPSYAEGAE